VQGVLTAFTGAGSSFNGGSGHDTLSIGGVVEFEGTLSGIERIHLQAEFVSSAPNGQGTQTAAVLFLAGDILGSLPADLVLSGTGTLAVDLDPGDVYSASGWTMEGAAVAVHVTGSSDADRIVLGSFAETVDDDGGIDTVVLAGNSAGYVIANGAGGSLTVGNDTLTGIELFQFDDGTFFWNGSALVSAVSEGLVADGYLAGAIVYIDGNDNGTLDADEAYTITDANGDFTLISPSTGALRAFGGTNIDTGLPNTVQMSAPDGASVINPLTTLVQVMVANGQAADATAAAALVSSALGLTVDVLNTDVYGAALAGDPAALEAQKAAATVVSIINTATDAGGTQAGTGALVSLGSLIQAAPAEPISLADASVITQVLENNVSAEQLDTAVGSVTVNAENIQQATTLNEVSAAQAEAATTGNDLANALYGGAQADTLRGFGGNDVLDGRGGADTMFGGIGDDVYFNDDAGDLVLESFGQGYDTVFTVINATLGDDVERLVATLPASTNPLSLAGNSLANEISGNAGANVIDGRAGADLMMGLGGNDVYFVDNAGDVILEGADGGYDTVFTDIDYALGANIERLVTSDPGLTAPLRLTGNALSNEITGNAGANWLDGGAGADLMVGGDGDDIYFVDNAGDVVSDGPDAGYDTVFSSVSFVLDTLLERVVAGDLSSTEALSFTGNEKSNEITGNSGGNLIDGGAGSDLLFGGDGADGFAFTTALGSDNIDALPLFEVGVDRIYLDDAIFTALSTGVLSADAFHVGAAAADADDRIIYDSYSGGLFYDADGNGAGLAVQFATLHEALPLVSSDFQII
jgi:hypothetical protein